MTHQDPSMLHVSIADDHQMFVEAIRLILDASPVIKVVSIATNGDDLLRDVQHHRPDVALVDIGMEGPGFQGLASGVAKSGINTRLVALTMHLDRDLADRVIGCGFCGFVVKDAAVTELIEAIEVVAYGGSFVSAAIRNMAASQVESEAQLTGRELGCLQGAERGQTNRQISQSLGVSERTVKFHFENIFRKLKVKSRGEAVAVGRRRKLI